MEVTDVSTALAAARFKPFTLEHICLANAKFIKIYIVRTETWSAVVEVGVVVFRTFVNRDQNSFTILFVKHFEKISSQLIIYLEKASLSCRRMIILLIPQTY